jgi:hypothetical protein
MREWRYSSTILDLALDEVVSFTPWSIYTGEIAARTHWIGGGGKDRKGQKYKEIRNKR